MAKSLSTDATPANQARVLALLADAPRQSRNSAMA